MSLRNRRANLIAPLPIRWHRRARQQRNRFHHLTAASLLPDSPTASEIRGDGTLVRVHAGDYERHSDFLHDETIACENCGIRWYLPPRGVFDADILAAEGIYVCEDCADDHRSSVNGGRQGGDLSANGELGTYWARSGGVVG